MNSTINNNRNSTNSKQKRVAALIGIGLLAALYLVTLGLAVFGNESTTPWFMACIVATIIVPILIWVYLWLYNMLKKDVAEAQEKAQQESQMDENQDQSL